ncbi:two-component system response regulator YesN [Caldicoprobacter guelmensis]|uniref:response regulator transcription factor n=1 Tax=Caldicoprobacter guelmensis TaxID=1170224 RepID=UPI00195834A3|nr:response regulator [Caldicoprobacter guelmensis]MBM7582520.1 two-component system response regulator YesN [Caldicoprobacter guelmensis]
MLTVLIVDDEPLVRSSVRYALQEVEIKTRILGEAENGEEALLLYKKVLPDVVITDVKMPGMDGLALIEEIRKIDRVTQFIIISGYAEFDYARRAMKYEVQHYLLKPIKSKDLEEALRQCAVRINGQYAELLPQAEQLIKYIDENYSAPLTLNMLAQKFNFSPKYISNMIKNKVGYSFIEYLTNLRIKRAVELLTKTNMSIKEIALSVGYDDQQYFHRIFKKKTGKTPTQYRKEVM